MIDYFTLQTGSEFPAFLTVLYTLLFSFSLSMLIAITYYKTTSKKDISNNFIQTIILSALVASTVVQAIGDSVAIGLGVLGALAIIRFRTNFRNPRNIIFLFAALASGISTGVYGYTIAIVGSTGFCLIAIALSLSGFAVSKGSEILCRVVFSMPVITSEKVEEVLTQYCESFYLVSFREVLITSTQQEETEDQEPDDQEPEARRQFHQYRLRLKKTNSKEELISAFKVLGNCRSVRLEVVDSREQFEN